MLENNLTCGGHVHCEVCPVLLARHPVVIPRSATSTEAFLKESIGLVRLLDYGDPLDGVRATEKSICWHRSPSIPPCCPSILGISSRPPHGDNSLVIAARPGASQPARSFDMRAAKQAQFSLDSSRSQSQSQTQMA